MIKEKIQDMMALIKIKDGDNNKKKIENLVVFIIILIITIIMMNAILNSDKKNEDKSEIDTGKVLAQKPNEESNNFEYSSNLEEKLKNILSKIDGVGKVEVLITYSESSKVVAMYNEDSTENDTEEKDKERW